MISSHLRDFFSILDCPKGCRAFRTKYNIRSDLLHLRNVIRLTTYSLLQKLLLSAFQNLQAMPQ